MIPAPILVGIELNPGPALSQEQRRDIVRWKKDGLGNKAITSKLNVDVRTVRRCVKRCVKKSSVKTSLKNWPGGSKEERNK